MLGESVPHYRWDDTERQALAQKQVEDSNPDLLVVAPCFENNQEAYAIAVRDDINELCMTRLQHRKHVLIVDVGYTQRWKNDSLVDLSKQQNAVTREPLHVDVAHGDIGWMTDSTNYSQFGVIKKF